jgi:ribosomal protein S6
MENERKIYEIGYWLSPLVAEEKLNEEISVLRKIIEGNQGMIMAEESPKMRKLAYPIAKTESAYFGWLKFMASPEMINDIKNSMEKLKEKIIRFLITEIVKETIVSTPVKKIIRKKKIIAPEIKESAKFEEIDKKLEELLANQ